MTYTAFATNVYIGIAYALGIVTGLCWSRIWRSFPDTGVEQ